MGIIILLCVVVITNIFTDLSVCVLIKYNIIFIDKQEITIYYTERSACDEPQYTDGVDKILLDKDLNSDQSYEDVLTQAFSSLQLNKDGDVGSFHLNFEHVDELILKNENQNIDMTKAIEKLDAYESYYSVMTSQELYERSMRKLDIGYGTDSDDDDTNLAMVKVEHKFECRCKECKRAVQEMRKVMKDGEIQHQFPNQSDLMKWRFHILQQEREDRLNKRRSRRQRKIRRMERIEQMQREKLWLWL